MLKEKIIIDERIYWIDALKVMGMKIYLSYLLFYTQHLYIYLAFLWFEFAILNGLGSQLHAS